jgi:hypothetical protein
MRWPKAVRRIGELTYIEPGAVEPCPAPVFPNPVAFLKPSVDFPAPRTTI